MRLPNKRWQGTLLHSAAEPPSRYAHRLDKSPAEYRCGCSRCSVRVGRPAGAFDEPISFGAHSPGVVDSGWPISLARRVGPIERINGVGQPGRLSRDELDGALVSGTRLTPLAAKAHRKAPRRVWLDELMSLCGYLSHAERLLRVTNIRMAK